ncbi:MAG: CatA-like O-acetyltransferase [Bacteroidota bacterium]
MKTKLDLVNWNRREHFEVFSQYEEPFHGINFEVELSAVYHRAKRSGDSFYLSYLYRCLMAVHEIENLHYRIEGEDIYHYERINGSSTIARDDHTFGFAFLPWAETLGEFQRLAHEEMARVRSVSGLAINDQTFRPDAIHVSAIPWIPFSGLTHARKYSRLDSAPKVSFGQCQWRGEELWMSVAVFVHHGLVDAYHVGQFYQVFQALLKQPDLPNS